MRATQSIAILQNKCLLSVDMGVRFTPTAILARSLCPKSRCRWLWPQRQHAARHRRPARRRIDATLNRICEGAARRQQRAALRRPRGPHHNGPPNGANSLVCRHSQCATAPVIAIAISTATPSSAAHLFAHSDRRAAYFRQRNGKAGAVRQRRHPQRKATTNQCSRCSSRCCCC